jgi:hypothetical protein
MNKNKNMKNSNENINGNDSADQSQEQDDLHNPIPNPIPNRNYEPFDFEINQEFIEENKKLNLNLVKHGQNRKHKFAPFTRSQRRKRRMEVYKLHFEHGVPAIRIAELMKVDRNTINNDLKILYNKAIKDYNPDMSFDDIIGKQLLRLETQRDRLLLDLCDVKDINSKITIERLIADIDFKVIGLMERLNQNLAQHWDTVVEHVNKIAEKENFKMRYTNLFELYRISIDTRQDLNKLSEKVWGKEVQEQKEGQGGKQ